MDADLIAYRGVPIGDRSANTAFEFCAWMAAVAAHHRGGKTLAHLAECGQYLELVIGRRPTAHEPLPEGYDWTPQGAISMANEMLSEAY